MRKLNVNELMIGDWVNTPKGNYRITAIQDNDVIFTDYSDDIEGAVNIDEVNQIQLTPEILEKNSFKKCIIIKDNYIDLKMEPYKITEQLYILEDVCGVLVCSNDSGLVFTTLFECKYVHQLQHILEASSILQDILV